MSFWNNFDSILMMMRTIKVQLKRDEYESVKIPLGICLRMNSLVAHLEKVVGNHKKNIDLPYKLYLFVLKETRDLSRRQWEIIFCRIFRLKSSYFYSRIPKVVLDVAAKNISQESFQWSLL